jgi:hypothetical protein
MKPRKPSEHTITVAQLITWQGKRSQTACAKILKTPLRTYVSWLRGEARIPGAVAAYIERDNDKH